MDNDRQEKHEECIAELHQTYHKYKLGFRGKSRQPLDYQDWLEHTAARLAQSLGEADEKLECLEEERDRYQHAAQANHECWMESTRLNHRLVGLLQAVQGAVQRGDLMELRHLFMFWVMGN